MTIQQFTTAFFFFFKQILDRKPFLIYEKNWRPYDRRMVHFYFFNSHTDFIFYALPGGHNRETASHIPFPGFCLRIIKFVSRPQFIRTSNWPAHWPLRRAACLPSPLRPGRSTSVPCPASPASLSCKHLFNDSVTHARLLNNLDKRTTFVE